MSGRHFWQKRYYDLNIRDYAQFVGKLRYIHRNPVKAGLCERPEDWQWSSFLHYATGAEGRVEIESEGPHGNANERRERSAQLSNCPILLCEAYSPGGWPTQAVFWLEWGCSSFTDSFFHHTTGAKGRIEIESEWTVRKREQAVRTLYGSRTAPL
ncbi:MAG: hypothetical protein WB919_22300, partial [Candidatus Sulfotelmatobacter sp.]